MSNEMSKADLMFREMGYIKTENDLFVEFDNYDNKVLFAKKINHYRVFDEMLGDHYSKSVYPRLHLAITEKMKELGWIE